MAFMASKNADKVLFINVDGDILDMPDIDEILASKTSIMPGNLLKPLNRDEVLDLLAYLLSRGDEKSEMFRQ